MGSWPTSSAKRCARKRRYSARWGAAEAGSETGGMGWAGGMTRPTVHRFGRSVRRAVGREVMNRSCTRCRSAPARTHPRVRLQPGCPAAPEGDRLPLLPSGPDGVHGPTLRGTRLSTSDAVVVGERCCPRPGIQLRYSGLRIQGTAGSPPSTTGGDGRPGGWFGQSSWRRGRDSNPRRVAPNGISSAAP